MLNVCVVFAMLHFIKHCPVNNCASSYKTSYCSLGYDASRTYITEQQMRIKYLTYIRSNMEAHNATTCWWPMKDWLPRGSSSHHLLFTKRELEKDLSKWFLCNCLAFAMRKPLKESNYGSFLSNLRHKYTSVRWGAEIKYFNYGLQARVMLSCSCSSVNGPVCFPYYIVLSFLQCKVTPGSDLFCCLQPNPKR